MAGVPFDVQRNMTKEEYDALTPEEKVERKRLKNREAQQNLRMKKAQEIAVLRDTLAMAESTTRVIEGEYRRLMLEGASVDVDFRVAKLRVLSALGFPLDGSYDIIVCTETEQVSVIRV